MEGRVSSNGFIPKDPYTSKNRDTLSSSSVPIHPEEVLFRRRAAPERYEEHDIYWANDDLEENQILPDSDLLKAVHAYASDFYNKATASHGSIDFNSMDETALIAFGILLEESAGAILGQTGDLVFVEGQTKDTEPTLNNSESEGSIVSTPSDEVTTDTASPEDRGRKRRKLSQ